MSKVTALDQKWMKSEEYRKADEDLAPSYSSSDTTPEPML
jgi:hypothetical protein